MASGCVKRVSRYEQEKIGQIVVTLQNSGVVRSEYTQVP